LVELVLLVAAADRRSMLKAILADRARAQSRMRAELEEAASRPRQ
jgi:hypothetical protein